MCGADIPLSHRIIFSFFSISAYSDEPNKSRIEQPKCLFNIIGLLYFAVFSYLNRVLHFIIGLGVMILKERPKPTQIHTFVLYIKSIKFVIGLFHK